MKNQDEEEETQAILDDDGGGDIAIPAAREPRWSMKKAFSCFDVFIKDFKNLRKSPSYLVVIYVIAFLDALAYYAFSYALIMHLGMELGLPDSIAGIFYGIFGVCISVATLVLGFVADSMGPRNAICVSAALAFLSRLAMAYSVLGNMTWLSVTILFVGIAPSIALIGPPVPTAIKRYTTKSTITLATAIYYGIMNFGAVIATPIIDILRIHNNGTVFLLPPYALLIALTGIAQIPVFFVSLFGVVDVDVKEDYSIGIVEYKAPNRTLKERIRDIGRDSKFWKAVVIVVCQIGVKSSFRYFDALYLPYVLRAYPDANTFPYITLLGLNPIIVIATTMTGAITMVTGRMEPITAMIIGAFIGGIAPLWMAIGPYLWVILFYVIFTSVGEIIWSPVTYSYLISLTTDGEEGAWMALAGMPMFLAKMLTGTLTGTLMSTFCPDPTTLCSPTYPPPYSSGNMERDSYIYSYAVDGPKFVNVPEQFSLQQHHQNRLQCEYNSNGTLVNIPTPSQPVLWGDPHQCYSLGIWGIIGVTTSTSFVALWLLKGYITRNDAAAASTTEEIIMDIPLEEKTDENSFKNDDDDDDDFD